jgi:hypothetical protein
MTNHKASFSPTDRIRRKPQRHSPDNSMHVSTPRILANQEIHEFMLEAWTRSPEWTVGR